MRVFKRIGFPGLFICAIAQAQIPVIPDLTSSQIKSTANVWTVTPPLPAPDGLRPCCAFGYHLQAKLFGVPVPFYRLDNIIEADQLGEHHYNNQPLGAITNLTGLSGEHSGIVYTQRGGFIDIAHIRDTADMTFFLFSHIWPTLGKEQEIDLEDELAQRRIKLMKFIPPQDRRQQYNLAIYLAGYLAFQVAAWHEVAQWYGYESLTGFPEEVSAFSPEDLYSNIVGADVAMTLLRENHASSIADYNAAMPEATRQALHELGAVSAQNTRFHFDMLDGTWWDSHRYVPEKFLVLKRNYDTSDNRLPTPVPGETSKPLRLTLPEIVENFALPALGELELWPGKNMKALPSPAHGYYTYRDFPLLAQSAHAKDTAQLKRN